MEDKIIIEDRGMIEIEDNNIKCFLGKGENIKSSEDVYKEYKTDIPTKEREYCYINNEKYLILYPIPKKIISVITSEGKKYKATIYFLDDIKNIISHLKIVNPFYLEEGKYKAVKDEDDYICILFGKNVNEIKDIEEKEIDYISLKKEFDKFKINESLKLEDINMNINLYSKIKNIEKENFFVTFERQHLKSNLNQFCKNEKREEINDVVYGIFGNYASGKTVFLIYYNFISEFPSIYLNLKILHDINKTKSFTDLLNNELIILFKKLKKTYEYYQSFIKEFLPYEKHDLLSLILLIIDKIKEQNIILIIDQYQEELFPNNTFIKDLKIRLFEKESKIKVIIASSINNGKISNAYLDIIFGKTNMTDKNTIEKNKSDDFIPYHFREKLVNDQEIKNNIKNINKQDNKKFNDILKLFNFLPLYYNLCREKIDNLGEFMEKTKKRIENKIRKYNEKQKTDLKYLDEIRKMIDNERSEIEIKNYSQYIPFKYFYVEKADKNYILRTHFPLIKDILISIIMKDTVDLFDGEISYDGNVIGSLLELNLIINIKNRQIPLDIDSFCKVDTIREFGNLIEKDIDDFKNKNIFITQNNPNGPNFDIAYLKGKDINSTKLSYIQVKKSLSSNKVDYQQANQIFEEKKDKFSKLFGFIPDEFNLVYITLINNKIQKAIIDHDNYKIDKTKKVSELGMDINNIVYSLNLLDNFCNNNSIQLYYYEPKTHEFKIKEKNSFQVTKLDLSKEIEMNWPLIFDPSSLKQDFKENEKICTNINLEHNKFLKKKRKKSDKFSYKINEFEFDFETLFDFAKDYFENTNIISYIDLHKNHLDCRYYNRLTKKQAMVCLKLTKKNEYNVGSLIYNNYMFENKNDGLKLKNNIKLDKDNDLIIFISFDSILESLKSLFP